MPQAKIILLKVILDEYQNAEHATLTHIIFNVVAETSSLSDAGVIAGSIIVIIIASFLGILVPVVYCYRRKKKK